MLAGWRPVAAAALAIFLGFGGVGTALADELLDEYDAYIGDDDLYNSKGARLTQVWQVIRQDRANYHRFNIYQDGDQGDSFFGSEQNRAIAEQMLARGRIDRAAARQILNGGVTIHVEIYGQGSTGRSINVTVY